MPISREEAARLVLERQAARDTFEGYCRAALKPFKREPGAHHLLLIDALDRLITGDDYRRLLITMPPGSAKSTYSSILLPGYFFMKNPGACMIGASHTQDLSDKFSRRVMAAISDNELILEYGVAPDRRAAAGWATTNKGEYKSAGVGGPITGNRADFVVIDDPIKSFEEAASLANREKIWDWFWSDLRTRMTPGGRIALVMTRWHEDDIAGRMLAGGAEDWRVLRIPAQAEDDDVLGRAPGEYLWPDPPYCYADELRKIHAELQANGKLAEWYSKFQGQPRAPDGNIFKVEKLGTVDAEPAGFRWVRGWDLAASAGKGDFTVGAKLGLGPQNHLVIADIVRFRGGPDEVERAIVNTAKRDGVGCVVALPQDPGQAGKAQIAYLTRALMGYTVQSSPETGDKETRAMPLAAQCNAGNVSVVAGPWNRVLIDEMAGFPTAKFDDQVDALSRAAGVLVVAAARARTMPINHMAR